MEPAGDVRRFRLILVGLVAVLVAVPAVAVFLFDLDGRTPVSIAQDALHDKYGLTIVDEAGAPIPEDSALPTLSIFSVEPGSTTKQVPFALDGQPVLCTVEVPDDPESATATCEPVTPD